MLAPWIVSAVLLSAQPTLAAEARDAALRVVSERTGTPVASLSLDDSWPVVWPDASLGVPEPGHAYATVLVPGSILLVRQGESLHECHAGTAGRVVYAGLWERGTPSQLTDLAALASAIPAPRVEVEGILALVAGDTILYEEAVEPSALTRDTPIALVTGIALPPFAERNWREGAESAIAVRVTGRPLAPPARARGRGGSAVAVLSAERIRLEPARPQAAGLVSFASLEKDPDRRHRTTVSVQGVLRVEGGRAELAEPVASEPPLPTIWVEGDLSGLPAATEGDTGLPVRVEVTGTFERRLRFDGSNGYGAKGAWRSRIIVRSLHRVADVLDYALLAREPAPRDGQLVAVRGELFLGEGRSDLTDLSRSLPAGADPGCLVTGDLAGVSGSEPAALAAGLPALVVGRLETAKDGSGFARGGTRKLRIEALSVRPLAAEELPAVAPGLALAALVAQESGAPQLAIRGSDGATQTVAGVVGFCALPGQAAGTLLRAREEADGYAIERIAADGTATVLWRGAGRAPVDLRASAEGRRIAEVTRSGLTVRDGSDPKRILGSWGVPEGAAGDRGSIEWAPAGEALLWRLGHEAGASVLLCRVGDPESIPLASFGRVLGWWADGPRVLVARDVGPGPSDAGPASQEVLAVPPPGESSAEPVEVFLGERGESILAVARNPKDNVFAVVSAVPGRVGVRLRLVRPGGADPAIDLAAGAEAVRFAEWSADGSRLSYLALVGGVWQASLVDSRGAEQVAIANAWVWRPAALAPVASAGTRPDPGDL